MGCAPAESASAAADDIADGAADDADVDGGFVGVPVRLSPADFTLVDVDTPHPWQGEGRPVDCGRGASATSTALQVETGLCHYAVWSLALADDVDAAVWSFTFWHSLLTAEAESEDAVGHVAVAVGDAVIVDRAVAIPATDGWDAVDVGVGPVAAGTPVFLHLHNHGANHWGIAPLDIAPAPLGATP